MRHTEIVTHSGSHSAEHVPDLVLDLSRGLHRFARSGGTAFEALDLAVDLVQGLVDGTRSHKYFSGGNHLCLGVSITMRVLCFIERDAVGVLRATLPHDVQMAVEFRIELPGLSVEFRIAGTSQ